MSEIATNKALQNPAQMDSETLAKFVAGLAGHIADQLEGLEPYYRELRERFHHVKKDEQILGCRTWDEYCNKVLNRTRRAINYWLAGGNPAAQRSLPSGERETVSHPPDVMESLSDYGTPQLKEAIAKLTPNHVILGQSLCRWCKTIECEHGEECSVIVEPFDSPESETEYYIVNAFIEDNFGGCGISGTKRAIAKIAVAYFIDNIVGHSHDLANRMVYEVFEWSKPKRNYNHFLYHDREEWFEQEVLGTRRFRSVLVGTKQQREKQR